MMTANRVTASRKTYIQHAAGSGHVDAAGQGAVDETQQRAQQHIGAHVTNSHRVKQGTKQKLNGAEAGSIRRASENSEA